MKKFLTFFFILSSFFLNAQNQKGENRRDSICVTMQELLLNPKKYNNKFIAVSGFVILEKNGRSLIYTSKNDYRYNFFANSILLAFVFESDTYLSTAIYNKTIATVVGKYNYGKWTSKNRDLGTKYKVQNGMIQDISVCTE